jgi:hypothetical protein
MIDLSGGVPGIDAPAPAGFEAFWPFFLSQHLHPRTRAAHAAGLTLAAAALAGVVTGRSRLRWVVRWAALGLAGGAVQIASHFVWEGNSPRDADRLAASQWWILRADVRMVRGIYAGSIDGDIAQVRRALGLEERDATLSSAGRPRAA